MNTIVEIVHDCARHWGGIPTNNNGDRYIIVWRLPTHADVKKNRQVNLSMSDKKGESDKEGDENVPLAINADTGDDGEGLPNMLADIKSPRADAPWLKEEADEFEDLKENEVDAIR